MQTSIQSPWQNGVAERWVGSCRRDLLDQIIALNERQLHRLIRAYVDYYHHDRIHDARQKDTPDPRAVEPKPSAHAKIIRRRTPRDPTKTPFRRGESP